MEEEEEEEEWGDQLRQYSKILQINPPTHFPPTSPRVTKVRWLAECESAAEFQNKVASQQSQAVNLESLMYSQSLDRVVFVWQVAKLSKNEFSDLRLDELKQLQREAERVATKTTLSTKGNATTIPQWDVVIEPAGPLLLSKNKILRATVVRQVDGSSKIGLKKGDLIIARFCTIGPPE